MMFVEQIRELFADPVVSAEGDLTATRDYRSYAEAFETASARKYEQIGPWLEPGRIVDIGCATGGLLEQIAADPRFAESDLFGVDVARPLLDEAEHKKATGVFANPNIWFVRANILSGPVMPAASIDSTVTVALTHEVFSYGAGRADVEAFAAGTGWPGVLKTPRGGYDGKGVFVVEDAAAAIYAVQNAQTGDLLRKTVVEAGHDPRNFIVYAFGGSGPAHCGLYAQEIGVSRVVVPLGQVASAFSAYGLASSNIVLAKELSDPAAMPLDPARVEENFKLLEEQVRGQLDRQGLQFASVEIEREIDMRYTMQLAEVATPLPDGSLTSAEIVAAAEAFEKKYADLYGKDSGFREAGIQAITYRVRGTGVLPFSPELPELATADTSDPASAHVGVRKVCLDGRRGFVDTDIYDYAGLRAGHIVRGPAVIEVPTTTVVVPHDTTGEIDRLGNLNITVDPA